MPMFSVLAGTIPLSLRNW